MYIKRIAIQGFKTYKDQTVIEGLSPKHSVVVGRNGSGKSNFFAAIRFVLSDAYTHMSKEERLGLLHESGSDHITVLSAYVEIVFDNTDRRLPLNSNEVIIRRTIGMKKDDYSLDGKSVSKSDIMKLFESAGFSRSNPYYIVPQGRITALTNAKDSERLELLKEVAGARLFEKNLRESVKEMESTTHEKEQIDEMLGNIKEWLDDLESEKEELNAYNSKFNEKKCIDYTLYDSEVAEITDAIDQLDEDRINQLGGNDRHVKLLDDRETVIANLDSEIVNLKQQYQLLLLDKSQSEQDLRDLLTESAKVEMKLLESKSNQIDSKKNSKKKIEELKFINQLILKKENELKNYLPKFEILKENELKIRKIFDNLESRQRLLYEKQGRSQQFNNKKQRDNWLNGKISKLKKSILNQQNDLNNLKNEILKFNNDKLKIEKEIKETKEKILNLEEEISKLREEKIKSKNIYDQLTDERKILWREEARQSSIIDSAHDELERSERAVSETMDRNQSHGLEAVKRIAKEFSLNGVYGPLGELIDVHNKYKTAVEITAGNSLFHVVVDSDETASRIMQELNRRRAGRVTFMPLNRLNPQRQTYPQSDDTIPLITKIHYNSEISKAVEQVFSKTIVCINLEKGVEYSRSYQVNAITLEGDRVDKKGLLTGGFHDSKRSRIDSLKTLRKWKQEVENGRLKQREIKQNINEKEQQITLALNSMTKANGKFEHIQNKLESLKSKLQSQISEIRRLESYSNSSKTSQHSLEMVLNSMITNLEEHENELKSPFEQLLSDLELNEIENINNQLPEINKQLDELTTKRTTIEEKIEFLQTDLNENLYLKRDRIERQEFDRINIDESIENLNEIEIKFKRINNQIDELREKVNELENESENIRITLNKREKSLETANQKQVELIRRLENLQKNVEKGLAKRALLLSRREDLQKKIRDLGFLPEEAFTKYKNISADKLIRRLNKVTEELKKYTHINKKSSEQYMNFQKQQALLLERRAELKKAQESIEGLMTVLSQRKDEAIARTFRQVSKGFSEVFGKLVPAGVGKLIMQRRMDKDMDAMDLDSASEDEEDDGGKDSKSGTIENYIGVSISVSFNSKSDEQQRIEQLSGGQKSLCAIALILAIQSCDPAPFYLFDEIDANLDTQYRTAVANVIKNLSNNAQFICTTFRNEMLNVADQFYGVMFNNKISTVADISREQALNFVEGDNKSKSKSK